MLRIFQGTGFGGEFCNQSQQSQPECFNGGDYHEDVNKCACLQGQY